MITRFTILTIFKITLIEITLIIYFYLYSIFARSKKFQIIYTCFYDYQNMEYSTLNYLIVYSRLIIIIKLITKINIKLYESMEILQF